MRKLIVVVVAVLAGCGGGEANPARTPVEEVWRGTWTWVGRIECDRGHEYLVVLGPDRGGITHDAACSSSEHD